MIILSSSDSSSQNRGRSLTKRTSFHMSSTLSSTALDLNSGDAKSKEIQDLKDAVSNFTQHLENLSKGTDSNKMLSPVFMRKEQKQGRAEEHIRRQHMNSRREQIKQILSQAEEIGISIRTGLSCKHYHTDDIVDNKSKPNEDMPGWWIFLSGGNKDNKNDVGGSNKDNDNNVGGGNIDNDNDVGGGNKDNDNDIDIKKDDNGNNNDVVNTRKNSLNGPFYLFVLDSIKKGSTTSTLSNTSKHSSKTRKHSIFSCH
ncbi:hypothetical protein RclHR1_24130002 [Rhizophagus clarus]|uniref:Uncharacterized protein n=1 Tax=Rhizophagus clarus TaxID=94130 RepID=A0A2Z6QX07_9GLOM|nr:hypothetical protein RclHR1_24130002 [Rhizophagus clarus]